MLFRVMKLKKENNFRNESLSEKMIKGVRTNFKDEIS